jgi:hypothetical protein
MEELEEENNNLTLSLEGAQKENDVIQSSMSELWEAMDQAQVTVEELQNANSTLLTSLETANKTLEQFQSQNQRVFAHLEHFGGLQKLTNKANQVLAIGTTLLSFLAIIMKSTHPITRLHTVCEFLFDKAIFGAHVTKQVLHELYKSYMFEEQKLLFAPWMIQ